MPPSLMYRTGNGGDRIGMEEKQAQKGPAKVGG
jgi:hypothetical protein